ncbi:DNA-directed RNA polymerase subunit alpha [Pseudomonadota bacterium]
MLDPKFQATVAEEKDDYSKLVIEPLKQGYGNTLGNALRRVLLTSLPGAAITSAKIKGVRHQFTSLEGMSEDIVELILNLKKIRVSLEDSLDTATLKLQATGPGEIKAKDIQLPVGVTISNPDLVICKLADKKTKLEAQLTVETGQGYSLAEERVAGSLGVIPIDALFSPIKRVNPTVQSTRVGRRTDFDKLTLEIWTDGTITAKDALDNAAEILVEHFQQIYNPVVAQEDSQAEDTSQYPNETLSLTVEELDLPTRIANALRKGGYKTVSDLTKANKDDIAKVKNLGERSVSLVEDALAQKDVSLTQ